MSTWVVYGIIAKTVKLTHTDLKLLQINMIPLNVNILCTKTHNYKSDDDMFELAATYPGCLIVSYVPPLTSL